jgi:hypothetical protein
MLEFDRQSAWWAKVVAAHTLHCCMSNCLPHSGGVYWHVMHKQIIRSVPDSASHSHHLTAQPFHLCTFGWTARSETCQMYGWRLVRVHKSYRHSSARLTVLCSLECIESKGRFRVRTWQWTTHSKRWQSCIFAMAVHWGTPSVRGAISWSLNSGCKNVHQYSPKLQGKSIPMVKCVQLQGFATRRKSVFG